MFADSVLLVSYEIKMLFVFLTLAFALFSLIYCLEDRWELSAASVLLLSVLCVVTAAIFVDQNTASPSITTDQFLAGSVSNIEIRSLTASVFGAFVLFISSSLIGELIAVYGKQGSFLKLAHQLQPRWQPFAYGIVSYSLSLVSHPIVAAIMMGTIARLTYEREDNRRCLYAIATIAAGAGSVFNWSLSPMRLDWQFGSPQAFSVLLVVSFCMWAIPAWILSNSCVQESYTDPIERIGGLNRPNWLGNWIAIGGTVGVVMITFLARLFHEPPMFGPLLSLSILWITKEAVERKQEVFDVSHFSFILRMQQLGLLRCMFFSGIYLSIGAFTLPSIVSPWLGQLAAWNTTLAAPIVGLLASLLDSESLARIFTASESSTSLVFRGSIHAGQLLTVIGSVGGVALLARGWLSLSWYIKNVFPSVALAYIISCFALILSNGRLI